IHHRGPRSSAGGHRPGRPELGVVGMGEDHDGPLEFHLQARLSEPRATAQRAGQEGGPASQPGHAPSPTEGVRYLNSMAFYESPRLGTRFALTSLIAFIVIGVVLAFGISGQLRKREEQAATDHALFVAKSILPYEVTTEDVISPMDPTSDRFEHLNDVERNQVLQPPVV